MKTSTFALLLLLFCANNLAFSQDLPEYRNQIKFSPLRVANIINPGFELSYERGYGEKFSTQVSAAYLADCFNTTPYYDYSGYKAMLEEKFFFKHRSSVRFYFSLGVGYLTASARCSEYFIPKGIEWGDDLYYESQYEDTFNLRRTGVIAEAKFGMQFFIKHFTMDLNVGPGLIFQHVSHSNRLNPDDEMTSLLNCGIDIYNIVNEEGRYPIPSCPFSIKLGYRF